MHCVPEPAVAVERAARVEERARDMYMYIYMYVYISYINTCMHILSHIHLLCVLL